MGKSLFRSANLSKIGKKLIFQVLMFSSALTLLFTGGQLYFEFKRDINKIDEIKHLIDSSYLKSIETAVWTINKQQAMALLEGVVTLPSVTTATITNDDKTIYTFQNKYQKGDLVFTRELHPSPEIHNYSERVIGILEIRQTAVEAYQNLQNRLAIVLLLNFVKTFFVAIFILYLFHSLMTRHLIKINNFMERLTLNKTNKKLVLDRPKIVREDELDQFVSAFNNMNLALYKAWKDLDRSEKSYRLLVESSLQGIMILDENWQFVYANKQCLKIFGVYGNADKVYDVKRYFSEESINKVTDFFHQKEQASIYIDEITLGLNKCERVVQAVFVQTSHEGLPALQVVMYDITHFKEMKNKQKDYEIQLIQNNKMASVGTMLSGVTHEINNPNHMIKQNSIILKDTWDSLKPKLEELVEVDPNMTFNNLVLPEILTIIPMLIKDIGQGSDSITSIVDDLKSFVRQDQVHDVIQFNVNDVIRDTAHLLRISIERKCHDFQLNLQDGLPVIWGYPQRLSQVFINLIINALESLEDPSKKIMISTFHKDYKVYICFNDEGVGIPKENIEKAFDVFFSTKLDTGGTGLGLSISQSIIAQHHGAININTGVIQGSELIIELPINKRPMGITLGIQ